MDGFRKKLGFIPFKGTLNIFIGADDVEKRLILREQKAVEIPGFRKGSRRFGKIDAYRCVIGGLPGAIIFPEMSQHGLQMLEVISPVNLRKSLGLQDGSVISVEVVDAQSSSSEQAAPRRHPSPALQP
jgi:riboflavin kinase